DQSPTAGSSWSSRRPAGTPPSRPSSVSSSHGPWWRAATRAGIRLSFWKGRNASWKKASQPSSCRFNGISFGLGTKKRPFGRVVSLRSARLSAGAAGGSANEDLSHLSNLLSARDLHRIDRSYTVGNPPMRTIRSVTRFLAPVAALAVAAGCGASGSTSTHAATTHAATTTKQASGGSSVAMVQKCSTSDLEIWLGLGGGGAAAGSTYYPL